MSQTTFADPIPGPAPVNLENIQGDVMHVLTNLDVLRYGLLKNHEHFFFFTIVDPAAFKSNLSSIQFTTAQEVKTLREAARELKTRSPGQKLPLKLINISFSQKGLDVLGIKGKMNDASFEKGQLGDAKDLGDPPAKHQVPYKPDWKPAYFEPIHGVIQAAGETFKSANSVIDDAIEKLKGSIKEVYRLNGNTRPGDQRKNEHFGWQDGISNPLIRGVPYPPDIPDGQGEVNPGVILLGQKGDNDAQDKPIVRPNWAFEGSIMVFRELQQLVPEFDDFLEKNPFPVQIPREEGKALQGARFMGRWKSGVPIQSSPTKDDPQYLARDKINNFKYPQEPGDAGQEACPYASHIRKMRPREDLLPPRQEATRINRKGITYGPEVQPDEETERTTMYERGLAFVCYQSNMTEHGFLLLQTKWANNDRFLAREKHMDKLGFDPIIGQALGAPRNTTYRQDGSSVSLPEDWVIPRGGEYFFTPSVAALKSVFVGKPYDGK